MLFEKKYGIDIGSSYIRVYSAFRDKLVTDHNMIAYRGHTILATGSEAYEMYEKAPADIRIDTPMAFGTISNRELQEIILYQMMRDQDRFPTRGCRVYFAVPSDISALERRAYYEVVNGNWIHRTRVFAVEASLADAIALGLDVDNAAGSMLVNIGAQRTRFSVLGDGRIIMNREFPVGGSQINEGIAQEVRRRYNLVIGQKTAARLKLAMGRLYDQRKEARKVVGLDSVSGLPREEVVSASVVNAGIMNSIHDLAEQMKVFFERIPPQAAYTVSKEGIYLTGGSARIPHIDKYLASCTGFMFNLSELYEGSTVRGLQKIMNSRSLSGYAQAIRMRRL